MPSTPCLPLWPGELLSGLGQAGPGLGELLSGLGQGQGPGYVPDMTSISPAPTKTWSPGLSPALYTSSGTLTL